MNVIAMDESLNSAGNTVIIWGLTSEVGKLYGLVKCKSNNMTVESNYR